MVTTALLCLLSLAKGSPATQVSTPPTPTGAPVANLIPNGDFSQGNVGFTSDIPYIKPAENCLWGGYYTVAKKFNDPLLHHLIAYEPFPAPSRRNGQEKVYYANAGGVEPLMVWSSKVKCEPNTRYRVSFNSISLSGHIEDGFPPHQVATEEWMPEFELWANGWASAPIQAGLGVWARGSLTFNSGKAKTVTIKLTRLKIPHGGGLIGLSNIEMVPVTDAPIVAPSGHR